MMELTEQILGMIAESSTNDHQQRSALGMARTWVDKRKPYERTVYKGYANNTKRDDLAGALVAKFEANPLTVDEYYGILAEVRAEINKPYFDPTMNGAKAGKSLLKPRESKKSKD